MATRKNLYYILLEDQQKNPMSQEAKERIQKNIENIYRKIKPPWRANPPNIRKDKDP